MKTILAKVGILLLATFAHEGWASPQPPKTHNRANLRSSIEDDTNSRRNLQDGNESSSTLYGPEDNFYEAESLEYFRTMNEDYFQWVNPDEIEAGATTCGFLYPDLALAPNITYPIIKVYVCIRFANVQPAAKGNMFVHCGGPSTLSDCTSAMIDGGYFSEKNLDEFNILSIDQRGMGRSEPSFAHEECLRHRLVRDETGSLLGYIYREEDYAWINATDVEEEELIKLRLQRYKSTVFECWSVPEFNMNAMQQDGTVRNFHFLEYSGTRHLAQDILIMQWLMNAPKLHLYGISYGTQVFSTFATIFPGSVGLMVLDSNISPVPDHYHNALTSSIGMNDRINYVVYSCSFANSRTPGSCPVSDLRSCLGNINHIFEDIGTNIGGGENLAIVQRALRAILTSPEQAEVLCAFAEAGDLDGYNALIEEILPSVPVDEDTVVTSKQLSSDNLSQPTSKDNVYGNPEYNILVGKGQVCMHLVRAQDRAGAVYDEDFFAKRVIEVQNRYTGAGTGTPGSNFFAEYSIGFYWPPSVPLPPAGNPNVGGIIVGLLYDHATPYVWAQEMRSAFPLTHLLTSKATNHGLGGDDYECQGLVTEYLETGDVDFVDGLVCGPESDSFLGDLVTIFQL